MFHDEVEKEKGSDEGADDSIGHAHGEDQEHPAVVVPEHELVHGVGYLGDTSSDADVDNVEQQLRESSKFLWANKHTS